VSHEQTLILIIGKFRLLKSFITLTLTRVGSDLTYKHWIKSGHGQTLAYYKQTKLMLKNTKEIDTQRLTI